MKYTILYTKQFSSGAEAFHVETLVKQSNKLTKYIGPPALLHGNTEVYTEVCISNIGIFVALATERLQQLKELNESTIPTNN